jgi:PTH1 family peptidyl-tRNA hydrolase
MASLKLIVGLGNPGPDYARTRHNAGFWFLDALAARLGATLRAEAKLHGELDRVSIGGRAVWLLKPDTYMNRSAQAVVATLRFYRIAPEEMLVAHDELDLAPGTVRLKFDGGHGGQNGLRDILAQLGHGRFHRLRIGIGHPGHKDEVTPWVLGRPAAEHEAAIRESIERAIEVLPLAVAGNHNEAMKRLHTVDRSRLAG